MVPEYKRSNLTDKIMPYLVGFILIWLVVAYVLSLYKKVKRYEKSKICIVLIFMLLLTGCYNKVPVEKLSVIVGIGFDTSDDKKKIENIAEYLVFRGQREIDRGVSLEVGKTIYDANSYRQLNLKKNYLLGTIRAYVISEERAKLGIKDIIDTCIRDQERNLNTIMVVSKGSCKDIFAQTPKEESTMADEVKELIEASYSANFLPIMRVLRI
ncbi:hypothetical protein PL321_02270 [Caloramator sp. mosi_1]|uniref:Ger(x)C family spore germination protein n=1 Tax=Caloramator sp. mosi_1 TaxID=3023090 RepID=UPI0023611F55|nr:hypothetical protein [Caloramator sp. mosi_1]WDC84573.1 hypothetical protein PL321_02270 [Caloramator sp. mosi_1]